MNQKITIKGAKEHNLKNIDVEIPKNKLIVITGISGSGKSSLAFDTIYAEGQRRYVESLSAYARQFLGILEKPDIEYIDGLSPAISIDQKTASRNPRSTVGTVTEIYDYLRLLYAKIGEPYCPNCGKKIEKQTIDQITNEVLDIKNKKIMILSPIIRSKKGEYLNLLESLLQKGYGKVRIDNKIYSLDENIKLSRYKTHNIDLIIDRLTTDDSEDTKSRVLEDIENAINMSDGEVIITILDENKDILFSEKLSCPICHISIPEIEPNTFSFNSPHGACPKCSGLGIIKTIDTQSLYNPNLTIMEGAIYPLYHELTHYKRSWIFKIINAVSEKNNIPLNIPMKDYTKEQIDLLMNGTSDKKYTIEYTPRHRNTKLYEIEFRGIIDHLLEKYQTGSEFAKREIDKYMIEYICDQCNGDRLAEITRSIKIGDIPIQDVSRLSIDKMHNWVLNLRENLTSNNKIISKRILDEIESRLEFLKSVGLDYLSINRKSNTLAGGEAQRIRLASQIGSKLSGILYVLDEPSIGLHQKDNNKLIKTLKELRDLGNTVIVVEHDTDTIKNADYIIDMGKGAGELGGEIIAEGSYTDIKQNKNSITGLYLSGKKTIDIPHKRKIINKKIEIIGAKEHNLKDITVTIPTEALTLITGVSGSGKSSLINDILYPYTHNYIYNTKLEVGNMDSIEGIEYINKVIDINQSPIGKTPRSNPATYTGVFTTIRDLFADTKLSKMKGYKAGRFSFNVKGGRCENCKGDGIIKVEMQFLPDIYVTCDLCKGKRYNEEALNIQYKGKNISEILDMNITEALKFFDSIPAIKTKLQTLNSVGLGYMKLGQSATTLSGGESQRVKLSTELSKRATGKTLYILDEPTVGLHNDDIKKLMFVINKLVDNKNTVIIIEHNMDVIKMADWIIDLGTNGGDNGGEIVYQGELKNILTIKNSYTGKFLKKYL